MRLKQKLYMGLLAVLCLTVAQPALAQYTSPNYKVEETFFGTGGEVDSNSASYNSRQAAGSLGVGATSSSNYTAVAGYITDGEPFLEMSVSGAAVDLATLSTTVTAFGAAQGGPCGCSFTVRTYLSSAYVVLTMSNPPTSEGGAILTAKSAQAAAITTQSVEEFGINLRANTAPSTMGADSTNIPDNTYADGTAATGYELANNYKYAFGDTIARSAATATNKAAGQTNYTISYIAKAKPLTPAGLYTMNQVLVAVATY